jgi:tetratricopeptide (TPR) repeat protein
MDRDNLPAIMGDPAHRLMNRAAQARREGRLADAKRGWTEAVSLCRHTGSRHDLITALKGLGQIERDLQSGDAALALYEEAVALARVAGKPLLLAHTIRHLGDLHLDAGRLELAERCYDEAVALYRENAEQTAALDLANTIRPLAILQERKGNLEQARWLWKEAKELYAAVDVPAGVAESSSHLAQLGWDKT